MTETTKFTAKNSVVMAFRVLKTDKAEIEKAARKTKQRPGVFARIGVLNETRYVLDQD